MSLLSFYVDLFRYAKAALECLERSPPRKIIWFSFFNISFTVCNLVSLPCTDILTQRYSTIKQGEILTFATTWMDLENIMLSKISQMEKVKKPDFIHIWDIKLKTTKEHTRHTKTHRHRGKGAGRKEERGSNIWWWKET